MTHLVLFLMVAAAAVQSNALCPTMCVCGTYPRDVSKSSPSYYTAVSCGAFNDNITIQLDETTADLTLFNFTIDELEAVLSDLTREQIRLPYLAQLTIAGSVLSDVINLTFGEFARIRSINLSGNQMRVLPDTILNVSSSLKDLNLANNSIEVIDNEPFRILENLEMLNLSANSLNEMSPDCFNGLKNLKCLDLSHNNLSGLNITVFTPLTRLQYLNLSNNHFETFDENCFSSLVKLQQLDLSWNNLVRIEMGSLQLPNLTRLLLAGNPKLGLSRDPALLVGTGQRLQTVDASRIGLKQVPAALTHSIRTLRLPYNSIKIIRCGDLDSYPLVQLLDINCNGLELIEDDALGRLDSLSVLYLIENRMKQIPRSLSEKLKVLHLERNEIEKINTKDLQGLTSLEVLLLNDNKISQIEAEAFNQLGALVTLDLSTNPIKVLGAGCLSGPMTLQVLRLSNIGVIAPAREVSFPLSATEHLITLDLARSPGLARQLLVDTAALAASRELQELDLSYTKLDYIRPDLLHYLPQLRIFHMEGNNINCSQLHWLAAWIRRQDEPEYKKITCASPPEMWGMALIDLQDEIYAPSYSPEAHDGARTQNEVPLLAIQQHKTEPTLFDNRTETWNGFGKGVIKTTDKSFVTTISPPPGRNTQPTHLETTLTIANDDSPNKAVAIPSDSVSVAPENTSKTKPPHRRGGDDDDDNNNSMPLEVAASNWNSSHEQRWNAPSTGEMSMFSAGDQDGKPHPGMLILAVGVLGTAAVLTMLAARFTRRRRTLAQRHVEDLEVSSLPGVTELW